MPRLDNRVCFIIDKFMKGGSAHSITSLKGKDPRRKPPQFAEVSSSVRHHSYILEGCIREAILLLELT
jgi:hypothetical protein